MNFQLKMEPVGNVSYWIASWQNESGYIWSNNRKWSPASEPLVFEGVPEAGFLNIFWIDMGASKALFHPDLKPRDGATYTFNPVKEEVTTPGIRGSFLPWLLIGGVAVGLVAALKKGGSGR